MTKTIIYGGSVIVRQDQFFGGTEGGARLGRIVFASKGERGFYHVITFSGDI